MFFHTDIKGNKLPPKTLCLTYDDGPGETEQDGPGPHTRALAKYLFEHGVQATFFVIGSHAEGHHDLLAQLKEWRHLVGNHTYTHPGLVALAQRGGDVIEEVARTDRMIRDHVATKVSFFRAPYGNWRETTRPDASEEKATSIVATTLNRSGLFPHYLGPINWDISRQDYDCWKSNRPVEECAQGYLDRIEQVGQGIVLMHDSSEDELTRSRNMTYAMTTLIVPVLKARGFRFIRLDAIPQVQSASRVSRQVALLASNNRFVSARAGRGELVAGSTSIGAHEQFGVVNLGGNRVALRASNGQYVCPRSEDGAVRAEASWIGASVSLQQEDVDADRVVFRTVQGYYLTRERGDAGRLLANGIRGCDAEVFIFYDMYS